MTVIKKKRGGGGGTMIQNLMTSAYFNNRLYGLCIFHTVKSSLVKMGPHLDLTHLLYRVIDVGKIS